MTQKLLDQQKTSTVLPINTETGSGSSVGIGNSTGQTYREFKGTITTHSSFGASVDILVDDIFRAGYEVGDILAVAFSNGFKFDATIVTNFSEVDKGYFVQVSSGKHPIFGVKYRDLAKTAGVEVGDGISFGMKKKAGFLAALEMRKLVRTNAREDYSSDAVFANFREITTTGIGRGKVYRGGHPIQPNLSRAPYAASLVQAAGINTIVNMCDTKAGLTAILEKNSSNNPHALAYYKALVDKGSVVTLNLGMNYTESDFAGNLVAILRFMVAHAAPYYLHCKSGKDRTGFVCAVLEALAGASQQEIVEDYMASYVNHFGVEPGTAKYQGLKEENLVPMLQYILGAAGGGKLEQAPATTAAANNDMNRGEGGGGGGEGEGGGRKERGVNLSLAAKAFLVKNGMGEEEVNALYSCIGVGKESALKM